VTAEGEREEEEEVARAEDMEAEVEEAKERGEYGIVSGIPAASSLKSSMKVALV
jgi:hypothetical protein